MDILTLAIMAMQFTVFGQLIFSLVGIYKAAQACGIIGQGYACNSNFISFFGCDLCWHVLGQLANAAERNVQRSKEVRGLEKRDGEITVKAKIYRVGYIALLISIFAGCYFLFKHLKKQSDLDNYYYKNLKKSDFTLFHPCRRMITDSMRNYAAEDLIKINEQMLQDGYTRAEIEKMNSKAFNENQENFQALGKKFFEDMDEEYGSRVVGSR